MNCPACLALRTTEPPPRRFAWRLLPYAAVLLLAAWLIVRLAPWSVGVVVGWFR